jgi:hypothetical protein
MICEHIPIWSAQSPVSCHLQELSETPSFAMQSYGYVTEVRNLLKLNTQLEKYYLILSQCTYNYAHIKILFT